MTTATATPSWRVTRSSRDTPPAAGRRRPDAPSGQITVRQSVGDPRLFAFVRSEFCGKPAEPDLEPRLGMMGDETGQPFGSKRPEVAGAIELMQASPLKARRVAGVVQVRGGDQIAAIILVENHAYLASALADGSDVLPSIAQWREQAFSLGSGPLFKRHAWTIPAERTRRPQWLLRAAAARLSI
jgi:hypothetical protein